MPPLIQLKSMNLSLKAFDFTRLIPLRVKLSMEGTDYTVNENGIPCCPHDSTLPMKREGSKSHLRSKLSTMKFVCPKMKWEYNPADRSKRLVCHCDDPCTTSSCGRMIYIYPEKNLIFRFRFRSLCRNCHKTSYKNRCT